MASVPAPATASAAQPKASPLGVLLRLHSSPPKAANQTSTERSTCTTRATRKKSPKANRSFTYGARANTSRTANRPEPTSEASASHSQPLASALAEGEGVIIAGFRDLDVGAQARLAPSGEALLRELEPEAVGALGGAADRAHTARAMAQRVLDERRRQRGEAAQGDAAGLRLF